MNMVVAVLLTFFTLMVWTNEKQCEAWNNNLQCDGYHMHAFKLLIKTT